MMTTEKCRAGTNITERELDGYKSKILDDCQHAENDGSVEKTPALDHNSPATKILSVSEACRVHSGIHVVRGVISSLTEPLQND